MPNKMLTAFPVKRADIELLQPVECPHCGYPACFDASYDEALG